VKRIRVLMITMPQLQIDVIQAALAAVPAVEVVGGASPHSAAQVVAVTGADVAILGDGDTLRATALDLLAAHPRLKVVGVSDSGRAAALYECRPVMTPLGEASPDLLVQAILGVALGRPEVVR
jgi:DNA-binding NarL/FixJ family response regulator